MIPEELLQNPQTKTPMMFQEMLRKKAHEQNEQKIMEIIMKKYENKKNNEDAK